MDILEYLYRILIEQNYESVKELFHRIIGEDDGGL